MRPLALLQHFRALRSIPGKALARRAMTLLPDYLLGDGSSRALVNVTLEVTYRCNIECEFCFLKGNVLNERRDELTVEEIRKLAQQARGYGASFFITGGEPFLRKDLPEIVSTIHGQGLKVGVNTNGLLVDEEATRRILAAGLDYAIFSLHGPAEVHDCLEGRRGAFDLVMKNLRHFACRKGATRVLANCVIARQNSSRLAELPALLEGVAIDGLTFQHETFLTHQEVARHRVVWEKLFPDRPLPMVYQSTGYGRRDMAALGEQIGKLDARRNDEFPILWKPYLEADRLDDWYGPDMSVKGRCLYIWTDTRVEPDGRVNACQVMPTPMGNVREMPLSQILNGPLYRDFRAKNRAAGGVFPACARCCKLYRNPVNFTAREPIWQSWQTLPARSSS